METARLSSWFILVSFTTDGIFDRGTLSVPGAAWCRDTAMTRIHSHLPLVTYRSHRQSFYGRVMAVHGTSAKGDCYKNVIARRALSAYHGRFRRARKYIIGKRSVISGQTCASKSSLT